MSRHEFPSDTLPGVTVAVGWDNGLQTYFGHAYAEDGDGEDVTVVWVGTSPGEIEAVDDLVLDMALVLRIDDDLKRQLEADRAEAPALTDSQVERIGVVIDLERRRRG